MQPLSDILPAVMSGAATPREPKHGLTTMDGRTNQLQQIRPTPLMENQLTEIQSQLLSTPFEITSEQKKIYGKKKFTDENGEYWLDDQLLGTQDGIDCVVNVKKDVPRKIIQSALLVSPQEAYLTHLGHLTLHKKFGSTVEDRTIMLNDYLQGLCCYPEFVVYQVCKHYWQNDRRPFVPFIPEMKEACQIFTDALRYFLSRTTEPQPVEITKQPEESWTPPTEADKAKVTEIMGEILKTINAA